MARHDRIPSVVNLENEYAIELDIVGGKGANSSRLFQRGFRVPDAFIVTTKAFQSTLDNDQIQTVLSSIEKLDTENIRELETMSSDIKTMFCQLRLPDDMVDLIMKHYDRLCETNGTLNQHVAVRSSATAEDLPENSFAGQQDTYLHVTRENLIGKIQECWASLFTARAISYRKKCHIDHRNVKLAVVVQVMVCSEASGVVFTANPMTGRRNEVIIDSTYGLGEALVSGLVTPDHYEIEVDQKENFHLRVKTIEEKSMRIIGRSTGGTETIVNEDDQKRLEALSDESVLQLAKLAKQIEKSYHDQPQDIEWSFFQGKLYILQARPITTLFPIPEKTRDQVGLRCMVSFGTIQGFLQPVTPLGESTVRTLLSQVLRVVGVNRTTSLEDDTSANPSGHHLLKSAANRIWIDTTGLLTSPLLRRFFGLSMADVAMGKIFNHLNQPALFPSKSVLSSMNNLLFLFLFFIPLICKGIRNFIFPRYAKKLYTSEMEKFHQSIDQKFQEHSLQNFSSCVQHFQGALSILPSIIFKYGAPCIMPGILSLKILGKLAKDPMDALALTRAVESNPTTEMNLILWKLTMMIRENGMMRKLFENETTEKLVKMYRMKAFEREIQLEMEVFFREYGCRGFGEIDIGRKRWSEEPEIIFEQMKNYLKIVHPERAINYIHERSQLSAYEALARMENELKWPLIQRPLLHLLFNRLKILFSLRESPKFHGLIRTFGKCREALFQYANLAQQENFLSHADDICYLYIDELQTFALHFDQKQCEKITFWRTLISERRMEYNKQMSRKRVPLIILSDGTTYYDATTIPSEHVELLEGEYLGSPVSPGLYEGKVRIVDDPVDSHLESGEILVCTATDPAWTSLFPIAGALVLEMGGMLQHGAIVSREYGLPAVVGVSNAKNIFHNGQRIQVNGSSGRIKVLADDSNE